MSQNAATYVPMQGALPDGAGVSVGIIGGSGLYEFQGFTDKREFVVETPFGSPSDNFVVGKVGDTPVAFLSRHGRGHRVNPTEVNYRANIWAMKRLGVQWIVSITACGSLKEEIEPGHMVIIDQFIDRTVARPATFYCDGIVAHVPFAEPICHVLSGLLLETCRELEVTHHEGGIYVNMEGPAFSTIAESNLHRSWGASVIGMTNMTEARLAREAEISLATVSMATDYDCWHPSHDTVTVAQVIATASKNVEKAQRILAAVIPKIAAYAGERPAAQQALGGGSAIMTARSLIPVERLVALRPMLQPYLSDLMPGETKSQ